MLDQEWEESAVNKHIDEEIYHWKGLIKCGKKKRLKSVFEQKESQPC